jgi:predicted nuclease of predicted toxin-antitoxin system
LRFLADENLHPVVVGGLRAAGFDVEWVAETAPGATDEAILGRPDIGDLVLLTFDRDFGDLIFNRGYPKPRAILYSRLDRTDPQQIAARFLEVVSKGIPDHHMVTITADAERLKPFPQGA